MQGVIAVQILIKNVIAPDRVDEARRVLATASFEDGQRTAGWAAAGVKYNEQAVVSLSIEEIREDLVGSIRSNALFVMAVRPKSVMGAILSRYTEGKSYGSHVDNAMIAGERADVSFTLFLSAPESYVGGELILESALGEEAIKPEAGTLFAYPSTMLHRVAPVTRGERLALVGWVRSHVRDAARRELLFDLATVERVLFAEHGKTREFDLVARSHANLLRMWVED